MLPYSISLFNIDFHIFFYFVDLPPFVHGSSFAFFIVKLQNK